MAEHDERRRVSSLLELGPAEFFKLDLRQIDLGANANKPRPRIIARPHSSSSEGTSEHEPHPPRPARSRVKMRARRERAAQARSSENTHRLNRVADRSTSCSKSKPKPERLSPGENQTRAKMVRHEEQPVVVAPPQVARPHQNNGMATAGKHRHHNHQHHDHHRHHNLDQHSGSHHHIAHQRHSPSCPAHHNQHHGSQLAVCSSASSTNSLPSISSSPSVSPSLVCPHLSLDDILDLRQGSSGSPHTIGLCARCRLDPPPNIHSPLSPHFRPHHSPARGPVAGGTRQDQKPNQIPPRFTRNLSDHQASTQEARRRRQGAQAAGPPLPARQKSDLAPRPRDDSLDYCLTPDELKRMQMSPSLRNSVEFIRRNSIESGRVVRIYKNGEPFEKPLRVCILRDEFGTLNHLLDHINTRLLVPSGARFLFHLEGQPVYSVHELKHNHIYVVSGTRHYDLRTSEVLKELRQREEQAQAGRAASQERLRQVGGARDPDQRRPLRHEELRPAAVEPSERRNDAQTEPRAKATQRTIVEPSPGQTRRRPEARKQVVEPATRVRENAKFSRYDDATGLGGSGQNSSSQSISQPAGNAENPVRLTRAKSELSALPSAGKPKKNVTFMDTGRGSSPAISELSSSHSSTKTAKPNAVAVASERAQTGETKPAEKRREDSAASQIARGEGRDLSTSEIGIQVSDSIDGFLIDLPVALPARGDDSNLTKRPRAGANSRASQARPGGKSQTSGRQAGTPGKRLVGPRQIVTITERQLSLDEMNELNDLSAGDHHHEVSIRWDPPPEGATGEQQSQTDGNAGEAEGKENADKEAEPEVVPDRTDTIAIGTDPRGQQVGADQNARLVTSATVDEPNSDKWQYPNGRTSSVTPDERPVSQSGPSESVRARVTTPTPSLSTCGDNNSLAMSYEEISQVGPDQKPQVGAGEAKGQVARPSNRVERIRATPSELPPKQQVRVEGELFRGLDEPARNFRLVWVNGFAINDLWPENTHNTALELTGDGRQSGRASGASSPSTRLTPTAGLRMARQAGSPAQLVNPFKPSERYHNWICHSRKHDELIYPAGSLVVLWCRWTNEQRYYSRHTSNVSALTLATLDLDLAASAQVCDLNERPQIASNIHLWSLTSLNTLLVVSDDQIRSKLIFSLCLRNTKTGSCELSIAARDEKQLFLFEFNRKLSNSSRRDSSEERPKQAGRAKRIVGSLEGADQQQAASRMLRASKALQSNQLPLFLLRMPNTSNESQQAASGEPTICFGRRHFGIWAGDAKQAKLRPVQCDQKSAKFVELIGRANCLCRLAPGEFICGDSEGNVALLLLDCRPGQASEGVGPRVKRAAPRAPAGPETSGRYSLELVDLLGPSSSKSAAGGPELGQASITCLTRVTGSLFMSADSTRTIRFWKIKRALKRERRDSVPTVRLSSSGLAGGPRHEISCEQLSSISLPPDLGFICTLILAQYDLRESLVEFYVVSTSNTILFGSMKLPSQYTRPGKRGSEGEQPRAQVDLLANSSLSVVYEGHETSASSLVADLQLERAPAGQALAECQYFTCSLDCRICKWQGKQLVWKSLLPSACSSLAVHPTGRVLAVGSLDGTVYILDKTSGLLISYFPLTPVRINCLAYSSDGSLLAAACANGSIFMLPVYEQGLKYRKVSIFQSPHAVVSLQFSLDNRYMLTSVTHGSYQELILWDLPNFRYMRDNVKLAADKIRWFDSICSGSEDVRAIWENANLAGNPAAAVGGSKETAVTGRKQPVLAVSMRPRQDQTRRDAFVVNLSCHRLVRTKREEVGEEEAEGFVVASDTRGYLRLFTYPAYDIQQGFYAIRVSSTAVNCCRFLHSNSSSSDYFVSTSLDGSICLWAIE